MNSVDLGESLKSEIFENNKKRITLLGVKDDINLQNLFFYLLNPNAELRYTADQALSHPWLTGV